jgi:hypothetical protein
MVLPVAGKHRDEDCENRARVWDNVEDENIWSKCIVLFRGRKPRCMELFSVDAVWSQITSVGCGD